MFFQRCVVQSVTKIVRNFLISFEFIFSIKNRNNSNAYNDLKINKLTLSCDENNAHK